MTTSLQSIRVPERGTVDVPPAAWWEMSRSAVFWNLVERGVVAVEQLRGGRVRLNGGCYVGRSRLTQEIVLETHEKVAGSLAALLSFASGTDFRVEQVPGPSSDLGPLIALLVTQFVESVRRYAARGRQFQYEKLSTKGSLLGGRLDVTRTTRLWARGLKHLAAFDKNVVSFDLPINRTVLAALREIERIGRLVQLPRGVVARGRAMAMLFDDCRNPEVLYGARSEAARRAESLAESESDKAAADMLALAGIILAHESFEHEPTHRGSAPRSWFLNLESLFERAVLATMRAKLRLGEVSSGRSAPPPIFPHRKTIFRANPDLVIRQQGNASPCIGDVKYKQWSGLPPASDIYQLLVHASAFGAKRGFLVFPTDNFETRNLGDAVTGTRVTIYGLDVRVLDQHIVTMMQDLGLLPALSLDLSGTHSGTGNA